MKKQIIRIPMLIVLALTLSACGNDSTTTEYKRITADEAQGMMDDTVIILDVRTKDEYNSAHIAEAILIPNTDIADKAEQMLPDKEQTILVYCRSGNRSKSAAKELLSMGYKHVYDFGGINDWTGELVK